MGAGGTADSYGGQRNVLSTVQRRRAHPRRPQWGDGWRPAALPARCFPVDFYGMQKEFFCFILVFFVKLKQKNLHLLLEPPYLKKKKEKKNKKINKKKLGHSAGLVFFLTCLPHLGALPIPHPAAAHLSTSVHFHLLRDRSRAQGFLMPFLI